MECWGSQSEGAGVSIHALSGWSPLVLEPHESLQKGQIEGGKQMSCQGSHKPGVGSEQETAVRGSRGGKAWDSYNIVCTVSNHVIYARALWEPALAFGTDCTIPDTLVFVMISDLIKWALANYFNIY